MGQATSFYLLVPRLKVVLFSKMNRQRFEGAAQVMSLSSALVHLSADQDRTALHRADKASVQAQVRLVRVDRHMSRRDVLSAECSSHPRTGHNR